MAVAVLLVVGRDENWRAVMEGRMKGKAFAYAADADRA